MRDVTGLSDAVVTMSIPALKVLELMDGTNTFDEIREAFHGSFGQMLAADTLEHMVQLLEQAHLLEGDSFEAHYAQLSANYLAQPARPMRDAMALGIVDDSGDLFARMLAEYPPATASGLVVGLVAPHLDYPRGAPCYAKAYGLLRGRPAPQRVVVLGTNHFGRSTSVVTTGLGFETPLGCTPTDVGFIEALERRCGGLRRFEMDHAKEHSVELQVAWLQHLFGAQSFQLVPILCPDPCGPTGMAPYDGCGVNLAEFVNALRDQLADDSADTLLVAGADLSHVGRAFGDECELDEPFLQRVRDHDRHALDRYASGEPGEFVQYLAADSNPTRVCSAGCMFTVATALPDASPTVLDYHQAVDRDSDTCVTCAAVAFTRP